MTPRRIRPEDLAGSGDLAPVGSGPSGFGWQLHDTRPQDIFARITGRTAANEYTYARVDDGQPATFPSIAGAFADQLYTAPLYEVTGRTDVPTDGTVVVRLFPLRSAAGYGFVYVSGAATVRGAVSQTPQGVALTADGVWVDVCSVELPSAGLYQISGHLHAGAALVAPVPAGESATVFARVATTPPVASLYPGAGVSEASAWLLVALVEGDRVRMGGGHFVTFAVPGAGDTFPVTVTLQAARTRTALAPSWQSVAAGAVNGGVFPATNLHTTAPALYYVKLP